MGGLGLVLAALCSLLACGAGDRPAERADQVRRLLADDQYDWVTIAAPGARIHFPAGSHADRRRAELPGRLAEARARMMQALGTEPYPRQVDLFYVDGRADMERLTGSPVTGFAYHDDDAIVLVFNAAWRAFERHELTHVVTLRTWGPAAGPASVEGIATFVDGECGGYPNGRIARTMADRGDLVDLTALVADFRALDDLVAYVEAGAVCELVREREGPVALRRLWAEGLQAAPRLLGVPAEEFERVFRDWLGSRFRPVPEAAWRAIRAGGCGGGGEGRRPGSLGRDPGGRRQG